MGGSVAAPSVKVDQYTGGGGVKTLLLNFSAYYVEIHDLTGNRVIWKLATMADDLAQELFGGALTNIAAVELGNRRMKVSGNANVLGNSYHYVAIRKTQ